MDNLPAPEVIAGEIIEDLQAALDEFREIAISLEEAGESRPDDEALLQ
jgi:type I restriction enzyme M protein